MPPRRRQTATGATGTTRMTRSGAARRSPTPPFGDNPPPPPPPFNLAERVAALVAQEITNAIPALAIQLEAIRTAQGGTTGGTNT